MGAAGGTFNIKLAPKVVTTADEEDIAAQMEAAERENALVIRVDREKGYIDLSKRRVSPEDIKKCDEKFARGKCVNSILRHVAEILEYSSNEQQEELYEK